MCILIPDPDIKLPITFISCAAIPVDALRIMDLLAGDRHLIFPAP